MNENFSHIRLSQNNRGLPREIMKISEHQLGTKFRSKHDIYQYLTETRIFFISLNNYEILVHLYMLPKDLITNDYLRQILKNEKLLMTMDQIKPIKVPRYPELSVKGLLPQIIEDDILQKYFPDIKEKKKPLDREYFFNILNSIYPDYIKSLIDYAQQIRNSPQLNEEKKEYILISDDWYEKLMSHPYISKKPGKTIQLLKQSTKILKGRRIQKHQEIGVSLKRFKGMNNDQQRLFKEQINTHVESQNNEFYDDYEQSEEQPSQRQSLFNI